MSSGLAIGLVVLLPAAQGNVDGKKYDKGAIVTVQGCVVEGERKDTYVFTGVKEWPVATSPMASTDRVITGSTWARTISPRSSGRRSS